VPYPHGRAPGQRYRIEQWAPALGAAGVEVEFSSFMSPRGMDVLYRPGHTGVKVAETLRGYSRRLRERLRPFPADVAFVYREAALLAPSWLERRLAGRRPLVFDFDDAIYLRDASAANARWKRLKPAGKAAALCRLASHVTVGNGGALAAFARAHARAVTVVPSTIDTDRYTPSPRAANPRPVIGWTGSHTTWPHLLTVRDALLRLRRELDFELRVVGAGQVSLPGLDVRSVPWRAESEADDLRPIDVGLMPLPDDEWSRGKCGMKALQYMALGIPPVVSPVGANVEIVRDGVEGFHARGADEWLERMLRLLRDEALRRQMGARARTRVEEGYSTRVQAPRVAALLHAVAAGRAAEAPL
jgi:glycosyltransferase involved in cell wall biosynthesis